MAKVDVTIHPCDLSKPGSAKALAAANVAFTEAAAGELRDRIRFELMTAGKVEAAMAVERAYVSTIHGLGLRILGEHAFAAGSSVSPRHLSDPERDVSGTNARHPLRPRVRLEPSEYRP